MPTRWAAFHTFSGGNKSRPYEWIRKSMRNNNQAIFSVEMKMQIWVAYLLGVDSRNSSLENF